MKERILKVIMICAFLFAGVIFLAGVGDGGIEGILAGLLLGTVPIAISSAIQYIVLGKWHPLYLFDKSYDI